MPCIVDGFPTAVGLNETVANFVRHEQNRPEMNYINLHDENRAGGGNTGYRRALQSELLNDDRTNKLVTLFTKYEKSVFKKGRRAYLTHLRWGAVIPVSVGRSLS